MTPPELAWRSAGLTSQGLRGAANQDAFLSDDGRGLWLVADGMGGHRGGEVAAGAICDKLAAIELSDTLSRSIGQIETALREVNRDLRALARAEAPDTVIGATLAAVLIQGRHAICLWSGDSRAYLARREEIFLLTRDHKLVDELVATGEVEGSAAPSHPSRHIVTRAVGATDVLEIDLNHVTLQAEDRLLLCTDGVSDRLTVADLADALALPVEACVRTAIDIARRSGGSDDATAIAIDILAGEKA